VIVTADHGDFMGDFGLAYKGQYLSEVLMRVPLIVKPPGGQVRSERVEDLVSNLDVAATCLSVAGVKVPEAMASKDLSPHWTGTPGARREQLLFEAGELRGLRTNRWKLIHYAHRPYGELYDLGEDPWESRNLWDAPEAASTKAELHARLVSELTTQFEKAGAVWSVNAPAI
jgi:uncharacterized sulfatase